MIHATDVLDDGDGEVDWDGMAIIRMMATMVMSMATTTIMMSRTWVMLAMVMQAMLMAMLMAMVARAMTCVECVCVHAWQYSLSSC